MKLLFDENLSRKLAIRLAHLYPSSQHVSDLGLLHSSDSEIWFYAGANDFTIVTADADFFDLAAQLGPPPKVIWLRRWSHPTRDAENLLRQEAVRISDFNMNSDLGILILEKV